MSQAALRQQLRQARRQLSATQRQEAERSILRQLKRYLAHWRGQRIGLYLAQDGEVDLSPLITTLWHRHKQVYLPCLHPFKRQALYFAPYTPSTQLRNNRYGIPEPTTAVRHGRSAKQLDLIITPLVGVDDQGTRLGMGGGYYDRGLRYRRWQQQPRGCLLGVAFSCQQVPRLARQAWDIPLNKALTEAGWIV